MRLDFHLAKERFLRAGLPLDTRDFWAADCTLVLRLSTRNNRDDGTLTITAAPYYLPTDPREKALALTGERYTESIRISSGLHGYQIRSLANALNAPSSSWNGLTEIAHRLYNCHVANDALHTILDPFALTHDGRWLTYGGSLEVDPNAYFRQPDTAALTRVENTIGMNILPLQGTVSCVVNGAGIGMVMLDALDYAGGKPAAFIDIGTITLNDYLASALVAAAQARGARVILLHVFSVSANADPLIRAVREYLASLFTLPLIIYISGVAADVHRVQLAAEAPTAYIATSLSDAVAHAAEKAALPS